MVIELSRGAWMNIAYSCISFLFFFQILYHIKLELRALPKHKFKTIPFYAFTCMAIGVFFRCLCIIPATTQNVSDPNQTVFFWSLYIVAVEFYINVYFFVGLIWIRLVVVFFKSESVNFGARKYVNLAVSLTSGLSAVLTIALIIGNAIVLPRDNNDICDLLIRIKVLIVTVLIAVSLTIFGTILINELSVTSTKGNDIVIPKIKFLLYGTTISSIPSAIIPIIYFYLGKHKEAQDWINLVIFCIEIFNNANVLMVLGRSKVCLLMRKTLGSPEFELYNSKSKSTQNSSKFSADATNYNNSTQNTKGMTIELNTLQGVEEDDNISVNTINNNLDIENQS